MAGKASLVAVALVVTIAGSAAAHTAEVTLTFEQAPDCPQGMISCLRASEPGNTSQYVEDPYAAFEIVGVHPVTITIENPTEVEHNVTFEPGTPAANYSHDSAIASGETVQINLTTVEEIPPGRYVFYGGQPGHRSAGEEGHMTVINGTQREPTSPDAGAGTEDDTAQEIMGLPAPGLGLLAVSLIAAARLTRRRS